MGVEDGNTDKDELEDFPDKIFESDSFLKPSELWSTDRAFVRSGPLSFVLGLFAGSDLKQQKYDLKNFQK